MKNFLNRIYNDYFMKSRLGEYENMLDIFIKNGYQFISIKDYKLLETEGKYIMIRHDIDTDVPIANKMFEIEKKLKIKSTFYFRLCTMKKELIKEIYEYGSEVGYHYEEIATYCKKNRNISVNFVNERLDDIKKNFIENVNFFEEENNIKIFSVASHGDFVNRKLGLTNCILMDNDIRKKTGINIEAYDEKIEGKIDFRSCDKMYPYFWIKDPKEAIEKQCQKVLLLIHTRWWGRAPLSRLKEDFFRIIESIRYR